MKGSWKYLTKGFMIFSWKEKKGETPCFVFALSSHERVQPPAQLFCTTLLQAFDKLADSISITAKQANPPGWDMYRKGNPLWCTGRAPHYGANVPNSQKYSEKQPRMHKISKNAGKIAKKSKKYQNVGKTAKGQTTQKMHGKTAKSAKQRKKCKKRART